MTVNSEPATSRRYCASPPSFSALSPLERSALTPSGAQLMSEECACALLCTAAEAGDAEGVKRLLDGGADVNAANDDWPPLLHAARNDHADVASLLLARGARANARDADGTTALILAARYNHHQVARALLSCGACPNAANASGSTALAFAAASFFYNRCDDAMTLLLLQHGADPNIAAADGRGYGSSSETNFKCLTPLMHAARFCRLDVTRALLQHGADPNRAARCGNTALTFAASAEVTDARAALALLPLDSSEASCIARLLLQHGANPDAANDAGQTALCLAVRRGDSVMVDVLLRHAASARALQWHALHHDPHCSQPSDMGTAAVAVLLRTHLSQHAAACTSALCCRRFATVACRHSRALALQHVPLLSRACSDAELRFGGRQLRLLLARGALLKRLGVMLCCVGYDSNAAAAAMMLQRMLVARSCSMCHVRQQLAIFYDAH
jgi:ankyrin repeat protein